MPTRTFPRLAAFVILSCSGALLAAQTTAPDLRRHDDSSVWRLQNRSATAVPDRPAAVRLDARAGDGVAWLTDLEFNEGTIAVTLRGKNVPQQSFLGIAFRGRDDATFDAVYFRPFNFAVPDPARRARAVQYMSLPDFPWPKLRAEHPGKYESAATPTPDPDDWFRARIVVENRKISVFLDDATTPCLVVDELSDRRGGIIGLWVGNNSGGDFADLKITPAP